MYEVNYNGRTSYANNYFYCRIQLEGLLCECDAERDLLATAKSLVDTSGRNDILQHFGNV